MTIKQLQDQVHQWITTIGVRYFEPLTNMSILTEEVGELARVMSRTYGEQSWKNDVTPDQAKEKLADELADIIWVATCIANQTGVNLTEAISKNLDKKTQRDKDRHLNNKKLL